MTQIIFTSRSGQRAKAARLIDELAQQHPEWPVASARLNLIFHRDYRSSREWFEAAGISDQGLELWPTLLVSEYAFVLKETGDPDRARVIMDETLARVEEQLAAGVKKEFLLELNFFAGMIHAIRGENALALDYLRQDAANRGLSAVGALKIWPEFDGLRDDPEFQALIAEQEEHNLQWRQRLEEEGILLTPEEVLALEDFDFNPFTGSE